MKKFIILFCISLSALFCSCTKNELDTISTPDTPVAFQALGYQSQTKAAGDFTNTDFSVFGYQHTKEWKEAVKASGNDAPSLLMNDVKVEKNKGVAAYSEINGGDVWVPSQIYYWPKNDYLTFAAYSPKGQGGASFDFEKGIKFSSFTVNPVPGTGNKVDLLYSDVASNKTVNNVASGTHGSNPEGVYILFRHSLSQIKVSCQYNDGKVNPGTTAVVKVTGIKVKDINTTGENFDATAKTWTSSNPKTQDLNVTAKDLTTKSAAFISEYYVMPQALASGTQQLLVSYTITTTFADKTTKTETLTDKAVDLASTAIAEWSPNYKYSYTLKISGVSEDPITFDPAVESWDKDEKKDNLTE